MEQNSEGLLERMLELQNVKGSREPFVKKQTQEECQGTGNVIAARNEAQSSFS